jgi:hypothetical protein
MKTRLKYPLTLFVVWHPDFAQGKEIANNLYSIFCRDIKEPLSRGLGIPVYYRSLPDSLTKMPIAINTDEAKRNAIILLVEENYMADENYRHYTSLLTGLTSGETKIYPVALSAGAHKLGNGTTALQFVNAFQGELEDRKNFEYSMLRIKTSMLHSCARLLMNFQAVWEDKEPDRKNSPVILFLSHAKKDGLEIASEFKAFVDRDLKLDVFFDTVDIADGYSFQQEIEDNIKKSALVVFHTDEYSAREWCRIEVLIAKRNKCAIVVVHHIKKGENRAFPYMGNTPTIALRGRDPHNFDNIVNLTLSQILNNLFQKDLLELYQEHYKVENREFITITSPPELFNYIDIYKKMKLEQKKLIVLYPDPPLGVEELKVLNEINEDILFTTPVHLPTL